MSGQAKAVVLQNANGQKGVQQRFRVPTSRLGNVDE